MRKRVPARPADSAAKPAEVLSQMMGQVLTLQTPIVNGRGRAVVQDSTWLLAGPDLPRGASVRVVGIEGPRLRVEPP